MCSHDELRVLDVILVRLELGRERYGLLDLAVPRDWERERAEELADAAIYEAARVLTDRDKRTAAILADVEEITGEVTPLPLAPPANARIEAGLRELREIDL